MASITKPPSHSTTVLAQPVATSVSPEVAARLDSCWFCLYGRVCPMAIGICSIASSALFDNIFCEACKEGCQESESAQVRFQSYIQYPVEPEPTEQERLEKTLKAAGSLYSEQFKAFINHYNAPFTEESRQRFDQFKFEHMLQELEEMENG